MRFHTYPVLVVDDEPIVINLKRALALLVFLAESHAKTSRVLVAETLWPDASQDVSRARLRRLCHELNRICGFEIIAGNSDAVWINHAQTMFDTELAQSRRFGLRVVESACTLDELQADMPLLLTPASGMLLAGFELDSDLFCEWVDARRREHQALMNKALAHATDALLAAGDAALALEAAQRMRAMEPYSETGYAKAMCAFSQLGDKAGVEAMYFACAEVVRNEFGIRPSSALEEGYAHAIVRLAGPLGASDAGGQATPAVKFADTGSGEVAYLEFGDGLDTIIMLGGPWSHVDVAWSEPRIRHIVVRLSRHFRVALMDRRGTGMSERLALELSTRAGAEDIDAVRKALGVARAWVLGTSVGGGIALEYAMMHPTCVAGLVLYAPILKGKSAPEFPWALSEDQLQKWCELLDNSWGQAPSLDRFAPSMAGDPAAQERWAAMLRNSASRRSIPKLLREFSELDLTHLLLSITAPTVVIHREGDKVVRVGSSRYLAEHVPGAELVVLPGTDDLLWYGDTDEVIDHVEDFVQRIKQR